MTQNAIRRDLHGHDPETVHKPILRQFVAGRCEWTEKARREFMTYLKSRELTAENLKDQKIRILNCDKTRTSNNMAEKEDNVDLKEECIKYLQVHKILIDQ